jgi:hypothetical protein
LVAGEGEHDVLEPIQKVQMARAEEQLPRPVPAVARGKVLQKGHAHLVQEQAFRFRLLLKVRHGCHHQLMRALRQHDVPNGEQDVDKQDMASNG